MSDWKRSYLCLCKSDDVAGVGQCLYKNSRQRSIVAGRKSTQVGLTDLPILDICLAARKRRATRAQVQILVLHDDQGQAWAKHADQFGGAKWGQTVEICTLERIGHVDVLLALALGFDHVVLQRLSASDLAAIQGQEIELARAMGGLGKLDLFSSQQELQELLAAMPETAGHWPYPKPSIWASRQDTARACAAVLLPCAFAPVPLPVDAPYGSVDLDVLACTMCQSCVWLCPTNALAIGERGSELVFVESSCIQCGMCCSICPEDALQLVPRLNPLPTCDEPKILHQADSANCKSCGVPFAVKSMMDRVLARIWGEENVHASEEVQSLIQLCKNCQDQQTRSRSKRSILAEVRRHSEPQRGR